MASAITPPVAMAAFAAASISGGGAISTAVQATRIGIVIFAIPFLFAFNPEILIVSEAGGDWSFLGFAWLLVRLAALIYMLASASSRFDLFRLAPVEVAFRAVFGLALIHPDAAVNTTAFMLSVALVLFHHVAARRRALA